jgi:hypothetical protein
MMIAGKLKYLILVNLQGIHWKSAVLNLHQHYQGLHEKLVKEGINTQVPWLNN